MTTKIQEEISFGLPRITKGMRLEQRRRDISDGPYRGTSISRVLVSADGTDIATIAVEAVPEVEGMIGRKHR
jgi:hypothetical protein